MTITPSLSELTELANEFELADPALAVEPYGAGNINDTYLGEAAPTNIFQPFQFEIPLQVASQIISREDAATLRLESTTWTPSLALGGEDTRDLGVMIDRITLE